MAPATIPSVPALQAAKLRWAEAQQSHALRGTPAREMQEREREQQAASGYSPCCSAVLHD